jgi:predicted O-methyltransferase YrrM
MKTTNVPIDTVPYLSSVIPSNRLNFLVEKCKETLRHCPGNVLEVGVYKGGSTVRLAKTIQEICPDFRIFALDTFSGHPYTDGHPVHPVGKYGDVNLQELKKCIVSAGYGTHVKLYRGSVEQILRNLPLSQISFAHIDCDLYIPTKYCAMEVPKLMNDGGVIYFDDYGHDHCPGATTAVQEVFSEDQLSIVYIEEDDTYWSCFIEL